MTVFFDCFFFSFLTGGRRAAVSAPTVLMNKIFSGLCCYANTHCCVTTAVFEFPLETNTVQTHVRPALQVRPVQPAPMTAGSSQQEGHQPLLWYLHSEPCDHVRGKEDFTDPASWRECQRGMIMKNRAPLQDYGDHLYQRVYVRLLHCPCLGLSI